MKNRKMTLMAKGSEDLSAHLKAEISAILSRDESVQDRVDALSELLNNKAKFCEIHQSFDNEVTYSSCPLDDWYCGSKNVLCIGEFDDESGDWFSYEPFNQREADAFANDPLR